MLEPTVSTAKGISLPKGIKATISKLQNAKLLHISSRDKKEKKIQNCSNSKMRKIPPVMTDHHSLSPPYLIYTWWFKNLPILYLHHHPTYLRSPQADP